VQDVVHVNRYVAILSKMVELGTLVETAVHDRGYPFVLKHLEAESADDVAAFVRVVNPTVVLYVLSSSDRSLAIWRQLRDRIEMQGRHTIVVGDSAFRSEVPTEDVFVTLPETSNGMHVLLAELREAMEGGP